MPPKTASAKQPAHWRLPFLHAAFRGPAQTFFFPAAALYGALLLPLTLHGWLHGTPLPPGLRLSSGHAHEMLFGFALAVIGGFLLNRCSSGMLRMLAATWLGARLAWLGWPGSLPAAGLDVIFAGLLLSQALPPFLQSVRKWRNHATSISLIGLALALTLFQVAQLAGHADWVAPVRSAAVLVLTLLMSFMGGRIIAPAVAGHLQSRKIRGTARVQPRIEGALLLAILAALLLQAGGLNPGSAVALLLAATLAGVRLLRWQLWHCLDRPDLLALGVGYGWLAAGMLMLARDMAGQTTVSPAALHGLTIGALGCLTLTVMARTHAVRQGWHPSTTGWVLPLTGLLSLAAILRQWSAVSATATLVSAWLWAAAFAVLSWKLLTVRRRLRARTDA